MVLAPKRRKLGGINCLEIHDKSDITVLSVSFMSWSLGLPGTPQVDLPSELRSSGLVGRQSAKSTCWLFRCEHAVGSKVNSLVPFSDIDVISRHRVGGKSPGECDG